MYKKDNVFVLSHLQPRNLNRHPNPAPISPFVPNPFARMHPPPCRMNPKAEAAHEQVGVLPTGAAE
jgi:hypothetical protein